MNKLLVVVLSLVSSSVFATCNDASVKGIYQFTLEAQRLELGKPTLPANDRYVRRFSFDGEGQFAVSLVQAPDGSMIGEQGPGTYEVSEDCFLNGIVLFGPNSVLKVFVDMKDPGKGKRVKEGDVETIHNGTVKTMGPMIRVEE